MRRATRAIVMAVLSSLAAAGELESKPLPAEVVAAWEKAGATTGWMSMSESCFLSFESGGEGKAGQVPAFLFRAWREGLVSQLPSPLSRAVSGCRTPLQNPS